ncbi:50S ribosomal protein L11 methyltransferase [Aurantivibrio plasticivorans]
MRWLNVAITMPWLQLHFLTDPEHASAIEDALLEIGAAAVTFQDNEDQPILEPALGETPLWKATRVTGLFDANVDTAGISENVAKQLDMDISNSQWEQLEDKDWQREWMSHYRPIPCGPNLWVCPSWCEPPEPEAVNILLDPGLAFGTGTHPTTLQCLQWLADQDMADLTVCDYGCGSGILGIAALLMGARSMNGVDIDPQALIATRDNANRNQIDESKVSTFLPKGFKPSLHDIVFANILAGPLVELAPTLTSLTKPGGKLCLSGILDSQAQAVMDAYQDEFEFEPIRELDHWVQLAATRRTTN